MELSKTISLAMMIGSMLLPTVSILCVWLGIYKKNNDIIKYSNYAFIIFIINLIFFLIVLSEDLLF